MFKDDNNGKTHNIYESFITTLDKHGVKGLIYELYELPLQELHHLKWLIEQQINALQRKEY